MRYRAGKPSLILIDPPNIVIQKERDTMKIINLGAMRWLRAALTDLPRGRSLREASRKLQQEEVEFFRSKASLTEKKPFLRRV